jgi:hypothetical protein
MSNTVAQLKEYFSIGTRKVEAKEMMEFWKSLSEEEKEYYHKAELG